MKDSLGLLLVGVAVLFLIATLVGHRRREHFTKDSTQWDAIRVAVERDLTTRYDLNLLEFRKQVLDQNEFFAAKADDLQKHEAALGVPMGQPEVSQVKTTSKLFDEKIRILTDEMNVSMKKPDLIAGNTTGLAIATLKTLARIYMIERADVKPKAGVVANLFG
jgi:hypothetical protein